MADEVEKLTSEIEVTANTSGCDKVEKALDKVKKASIETGDSVNSLKEAIEKVTGKQTEAIKISFDKSAFNSDLFKAKGVVMSYINQMKEAMNSGNNDQATTYAKALSKELNISVQQALKLADCTSKVVENINGINVTKTYKGLKLVNIAIGEVKEKSNSAKKTVDALGRSAEKSAKKFSLFKSAGNLVEKALSPIKKFARVGMYRLFRKAVQGVFDAFKDGYGYVKSWSDQYDGNLTKSVGIITDAVTQIKKALGTIVEPIINAVAPIIDWLADKMTKLAVMFSKAMATITGQDYYLSPTKKITKSFDDTTKAVQGTAKAIKDFTLGFDELNVISDKAGATIGGGAGKLQEIVADYEDFKINKDVIDMSDQTIPVRIGVALDEIVFGKDGLDTLANDFWNNFAGKGYSVWKYLFGIVIPKGIVDMVDDVEIKFKAKFPKLGKLLFAKIDIVKSVGTVIGKLVASIKDGTIGSKLKKGFDEVNKILYDKLTGALKKVIEWFKKIFSSDFILELNTKGLSNATNNVGGLGEKLKNIIFGDSKDGKTFSVTVEGKGNFKPFYDDVFKQATETSEKSAKAWTDAWKKANKEVSDSINGLLVRDVKTSVSSISDMFKGLFDKSSGDKLAENITKAFEPFNNINIKKVLNEGLDRAIVQLDHITTKQMPATNNVLNGIRAGVLAINSSLDSTTSKFDAMVKSIVNGVNSAGGIFNGIKFQAPKQYASGGFPDVGEVFIARERGSEMIGSIGNRPAVANNDQIVAGITNGVATANSEVVNAIYDLLTVVQNKSTIVNIGDNDIGKANDRYSIKSGTNVTSGYFANAY